LDGTTVGAFAVTRLPSEFDLQRAICIHLDGTPRTPAALMPGVVYWHTPNGGSRRDGFEAKRLKQMGVKPGIPDLFFLRRGALYGMELKRLGGTTSESQDSMHARLLAAGMMANVVIDNLADARAWLFQHLLTRFP
jgi:hypothetical protein